MFWAVTMTVRQNKCACVCVCPQADFSQGGMEGGDGGQVNATKIDLTSIHHSNDIQHEGDTA